MKLSRRGFPRQLASVLACCTLSLGTGQAMVGQTEEPVRPISLLMPFAVGVKTDIMVCAVAEPLGKELGLPLLAVNSDGEGDLVYAPQITHSAANPDRMGIATAFGHLQMELLQSLSGLARQHAPYGGGPALNNVVTGAVPILFDHPPSSLSPVTGGKLHPISIAIAALPQMPTVKELGLGPANRMAYDSIVGTNHLPKPIIYKIHADTAKVPCMANVRQRIEDTGAQIISGSPKEFVVQIKVKYEGYEGLFKQRKLPLG